ncbi:MAG: hypothetical protein WBE68_16045 [Candidatus Nitrosopolaris sp.]
MPPFRQLYQETISDLQMELKAALVDLGHKSAFDLLLKEAWNPEVAAMGNSTLPTVLDKEAVFLDKEDVDHTSQEAHCYFSSRERSKRCCNI